MIVDVVIEALGHPQKERLKHEDTNISNWLQGQCSSVRLLCNLPARYLHVLLHLCVHLEQIESARKGKKCLKPVLGHSNTTLVPSSAGLESVTLFPLCRAGKLQCQCLQEVPHRTDWALTVRRQSTQGRKKVWYFYWSSRKICLNCAIFLIKVTCKKNFSNRQKMYL